MSNKTVKYEDSAEYMTNIKGWVCTNCHRYHGDGEHSEHWAKHCCSNDRPCKTEGCKGRALRNYSLCEECLQKNQDEREQARFEKAELVEYEGPFWMNDHLYFDFASYLDDLDDDCEPAEYAYVPVSRPLKLDMYDILNDMMESHEIDPIECDPDLDGVSELRKAIDAFNEANKNHLYYWESFKKKFRLPRVRWDDEECEWVDNE